MSSSLHNSSDHEPVEDEKGLIPPPPPPPRDLAIGPMLVCCMSFIVLVFTVVSVGIPWYRKRQYKPSGGPSVEQLFFLFKHEEKVVGSPTVVTHPSSYCEPVRWRVKVLESFAIVSSAMTLIAFILCCLHAYILYTRSKPNRVLYIVMLIFAGAAMGSLTIEVSFNFNIYLWSFKACGAGTSYHSQLYEPYVGFGLTVTAWVLSGLSGIIAANDLTVPMDARTVDQGIHSFTLLSFAALLFAVVSCPIPHWFYKDGTTNKVTDILLWRERVGRFDWDTTASTERTSFWVKDYGCSALTRYFRAAEVFSVLSIFFMACSSVTGLLLWKSLAGTRLPAVIFSIAAACVALVQMALELRIYYGQWCDGAFAYSDHMYVLGAGFALAATSFCVMVVASGFIVGAYHLTSRYFPAKIPGKTIKIIALEEVQ